MTANAGHVDEARYMAAGADAHIAKPVAPDLLLAVLSRWILFKSIEDPAAAKDAGQPALPDNISGLNVELGLKRAAGNRTLYLTLLKLFLMKHRNDARVIREALDVDDLSAASRGAHTLRSVAAMVGAEMLAQQAGEVETAIRSGSAAVMIDTLLGELVPRLDAMMVALAAALPPDDAVAPVTVDSIRIADAIRAFARILAENDATAMSVLSEHEAVLSSALGDRFPAIRAATEMFELHDALAALKEAAHSLGVEV
jgi:two-component system sensor histidine kinase/response regulator